MASFTLPLDVPPDRSVIYKCGANYISAGCTHLMKLVMLTLEHPDAMKHIKKFEFYRIERKREEIIKESVLQVNDIYKVKSMIDIPQSLINAYVKKESFDKYEEGAFVKVVYKNDDLDHAKLLEEIE